MRITLVLKSGTVLPVWLKVNDLTVVLLPVSCYRSPSTYSLASHITITCGTLPVSIGIQNSGRTSLAMDDIAVTSRQDVFPHLLPSNRDIARTENVQHVNKRVRNTQS